MRYPRSWKDKQRKNTRRRRKDAFATARELKPRKGEGLAAYARRAGAIISHGKADEER